jgi:hypothetical protein
MKKSLGYIASFKEKEMKENNVFVSFITVIGSKKEVMKYKNKKDFVAEELFEGDSCPIMTSLEEISEYTSDTLDEAWVNIVKYCFDERLKSLLELYYRSIDAILTLSDRINFEEEYSKWLAKELKKDNAKEDMEYLFSYLQNRYEQEVEEFFND